MELAHNHDVIIKEHHSGTRKESYSTNTCPGCGTFVGQHYLFEGYYCAAIYGDCQFEQFEIT